jgi:hypothetical protein
MASNPWAAIEFLTMVKLDCAISAIRSGRAQAVALERIRWLARDQWKERSHRLVTPMVADMLVGPTSRVFTDPASLLSRLFPRQDSKPILAEYAEVEAEMQRRRGAESHVYGSNFDVQRATASLLYCLVRLRQMEEVWETGVADGASSFVILQAMAKNGSGTLHSTDIRSDAGGLIHSGERSRWDLHILDRTRPALALRSYSSTLPKLDLFVHDSMHRYGWQMSELKAAAPHLKADSLIASDDVDSSFAYADFCASRGLDPQYLLDESKFFGIAPWAPLRFR